ncbi:hypothetical protein Tco_0943360 [Tanacetum coccineum]
MIDGSDLTNYGFATHGFVGTAFDNDHNEFKPALIELSSIDEFKPASIDKASTLQDQLNLILADFYTHSPCTPCSANAVNSKEHQLGLCSIQKIDPQRHPTREETVPSDIDSIQESVATVTIPADVRLPQHTTWLIKMQVVGLCSSTVAKQNTYCDHLVLVKGKVSLLLFQDLEQWPELVLGGGDSIGDGYWLKMILEKSTSKKIEDEVQRIENKAKTGSGGGPPPFTVAATVDRWSGDDAGTVITPRGTTQVVTRGILMIGVRGTVQVYEVVSTRNDPEAHVAASHW